ncbi:uncharacterized protein JN550_001575 [Neoarthrinium moseri]|uniref:uncharacterized protein n=1 Tax=Neoarthrinium moseri TaxID=1658444 RepID=UPI001FDC46F6|nr:uncharacterized protein JN550_001575 [Neoarthrinium moseri]KAI1876079.1 hypothetical protein JN550_001575 [Neoarthrinium moseri]
MSRWHESHCRLPDVSVIGGLPCCSHCFAIFPVDDVKPDSQLRGPQIPSHSGSLPLNLSWPQSVKYLGATAPRGLNSGSATDSKVQSEEDSSKDGSEAIVAKRQVKETHGEDGRKTANERSAPGYTNLIWSDEIRLLRLSPGTPGDPVHANFVNIQLDQGPPIFEALSYTWADESGDATRCRPIFIGPYWDIYVATRNCERALSNIRRPRLTRDIWVDSICINQDDDTERSAQVSLIPRIYAEAESVVVYLGEESPESGAALEILVLQDRASIFSDLEASRLKHDLEQRTAAEHTKQQLEDIFGRPYFKRLWVVQELIQAKSAVICCGTQSALWPLRGLESLRSLIDIPRWTRYRNFRSNITEMNFVELIVDTRDCLCSDPRDKVFAILDAMVESRLRPYQIFLFEPPQNSSVEIASEDGSLQVSAMRICRICDRFSTSKSAKGSYASLSSPLISDLIDYGPGEFHLFCPVESLTGYEVVFWLHGISSFAILKCSSHQSRYSFVSLCSLAPMSHDPPRTKEGYFAVRDFSTTEEEVIRGVDESLRPADQATSWARPTSSGSFMSTMQRLADATLFFENQSRGDSLQKRWLTLRDEMEWYLRSDSHRRNFALYLIELEAVRPGGRDASYYHPPSRSHVGHLKQLNKLLWSLIPAGGSWGHHYAGSEPPEDGSIQDASDIIYRLMNWASVTMEVIDECSRWTSMMNSSWVGDLTGASIPAEWAARYELFEENITAGLNAEITSLDVTLLILDLFSKS